MSVEPNAPAHPAFAQPPAAPGEARPATIYMTPEQYAAQQKELADLRGLKSAVQAQYEAAEQARLKALAEKGMVEQALTEQRGTWEKKHAEALTNYSKLETSWLGEHSAKAVSECLNGLEFSGPNPAKTAALARRLLADEVEAVMGPDGKPLVRDRSTLRPAADYLRERLASEDFAVLLKPRSGGGAGSDGTQAPAPTQQPADPTGDYMKAYRERMAAMRAGTL